MIVSYVDKVGSAMRLAVHRGEVNKFLASSAVAAAEPYFAKTLLKYHGQLRAFAG